MSIDIDFEALKKYLEPVVLPHERREEVNIIIGENELNEERLSKLKPNELVLVTPHRSFGYYMVRERK